MTPEHYQKLADAGLTVEQIGVVMRILSESEAAMKAADEARKTVARERVQRWRDKQPKADVTLQKRNGNATLRLTRAKESSSLKDLDKKEERKKEDASPSAQPKKATRIPDGFMPDVVWAAQQGLVTYGIEADQFLDFWRAKSGKDGTKQDWPATWRVWVRNALKRQRPSATAPPPREPREPRNAGERAYLKLQEQNDEPPSTANGRVDPGDGRRQIEGSGIARRFAVAAVSGR